MKKEIRSGKNLINTRKFAKTSKIDIIRCQHTIAWEGQPSCSITGEFLRPHKSMALSFAPQTQRSSERH